MTAELRGVRGEHRFYRPRFPADIKNGQPAHPFVKMRDQLLVAAEADNFVNEQLGQVTESDDLVEKGIVSRCADTMVFPQEIFYHMECFLFHYIGIEKNDAGLSRDEPFGIMNVVAALSKNGGRLSEYVFDVIQQLEFGGDVFLYIRTDKTISPRPAIHRRRSL